MSVILNKSAVLPELVQGACGGFAYLLKMLPSLYQTHLENQLEESESLFINILINVVQEIKQVSLEKIANAIPLPMLFESRRKKLQRFLSLPILKVKKLWFPVIKDWLAQTFRENEFIYLVVDRTKWERQNLIIFRVIYDKRAISIYFELLPKLGNSNFFDLHLAQKNKFDRVLENICWSRGSWLTVKFIFSSLPYNKRCFLM